MYKTGTSDEKLKYQEIKDMENKYLLWEKIKFILLDFVSLTEFWHI